MDNHTFKEIFRGAARHVTAPTPDCPDDGVLVLALDGALDPEQRAVFESHVADCDHCIARLGRIGRLWHSDGDEHVPDISLARARKLVRKPSLIRQAPRWAAAAAVVLAVLSTALLLDRQPELTGLPGTAPPEVRTLDREAYRPAVLFPGNGETVGIHGLKFRWSEVSDSLHYDIRVVSADGGLVWQERVSDTEWRLPDDLRLEDGEEYYFRVDAYLTEAKSVSSRHVLFRVETAH